MSKHAFWISTGIAIIILGVAIERLISAFPNIASLSTAAFLIFVLVGISILIVNDYRLNYFRKKYPNMTPIYTESEQDAFDNNTIHNIKLSMENMSIH